jgi:hypothetical protein
MGHNGGGLETQIQHSPTELMQKLPGYDPDVAKNRAEARKIMERAGYGPDKRLSLKVSTRDIASYRDPAVILLSQLKHITSTPSSRSSTRRNGIPSCCARITRSAPT